MKITNCRSFFVFFIYWGAAVLVIVNGQRTTDDVMDTYENTELRKELAKVKSDHAAEIAELRSQLNKLTGELATMSLMKPLET